MNIDITINHDDLHRECWSFYLLTQHSAGARLFVDEWRDETRKSKRHKFRPVRAYSQRGHPNFKPKDTHPPITDELKALVLAELVKRITFEGEATS